MPDAVAPDGSERFAERDAVWDALGALPARQRAALVLRHYEDLPDDAIAAALGCRRATVRSLCARGLDRLRPLLSEPAEEANRP